MVDAQQKISDSMYLINKKRDERQTGNGVMGKDDFMKLLIAQLQNQDPTNPMKDNEFIAQMAQFSALEQTMNLSKAFDRFAEAQNQSQLIQYNSFIGKTVQWHEVSDKLGTDGKPVVNEGKGVITAVKFVDGSVKFKMEDGKELTPGNISEVLSESGSANVLVEASHLIGKTVTYMDGADEKTAVVVSVSNKDGNLLYILDNGNKIESNSLTGVSQ